jgi:uncharacterized membrane protein YgcG
MRAIVSKRAITSKSRKFVFGLILAGALHVATAQHAGTLLQRPPVKPLRELAVVALPNGTRPEGVTTDNGSGFYVASLAGVVLHVDGEKNITSVVAREPGVALTVRQLKRRYCDTAHVSHVAAESAPYSPQNLIRPLRSWCHTTQGVKYDETRHRLYVTGALTGALYMYDLVPGSRVRVAEAGKLLLSVGGYTNDVALGAERVYVSDSFKPLVHSLPRDFDLRRPPTVTRHPLGKGFVGVPMIPLLEGANGLAEAAPGLLLVANYKQGQVYLLDTRSAVTQSGTGNSSSSGSGSSGSSSGGGGKGGSRSLPVSLGLPAHVSGKRIWPDGLLVTDGGQSLFVADNFNNRILKISLGWSLNQGAAVPRARVVCVLTSPLLAAPTTLTVASGRLWAINAHFLDCPFFLPCTWQEYSIVGAKLSDLCE